MHEPMDTRVILYFVQCYCIGQTMTDYHRDESLSRLQSKTLKYLTSFTSLTTVNKT